MTFFFGNHLLNFNQAIYYKFIIIIVRNNMNSLTAIRCCLCGKIWNGNELEKSLYCECGGTVMRNDKRLMFFYNCSHIPTTRSLVSDRFQLLYCKCGSPFKTEAVSF